MKHYRFTFLLVGSIIFLACKKDRVCNCTVRTSGITTTHTQTAGFPPILPATDTITYQPLFSENTSKRNYTKVSKKAMRSNCFETSEETLNQTNSNTSPGIFTITTTDSGTKKYECKIE